MCAHYRLSKELQQKDKVIESLRTKLNQHHHSRSNTPCSSHALSDTTDQSDRISYVSDEHRSTDEDLDPYVDAAGEHGQRDTRASARVGTGENMTSSSICTLHQRTSTQVIHSRYPLFRSQTVPLLASLLLLSCYCSLMGTDTHTLTPAGAD